MLKHERKQLQTTQHHTEKKRGLRNKISVKILRLPNDKQNRFPNQIL